MFATVVAAVMLFLGLRLLLPLTFVVAVVALWVRRFDVSRFRLTLGVLACKIKAVLHARAVMVDAWTWRQAGRQAMAKGSKHKSDNRKRGTSCSRTRRLVLVSRSLYPPRWALRPVSPNSSRRTLPILLVKFLLALR